MGLVEIGLETGLQDVEGRRTRCCCHASYSAENVRSAAGVRKCVRESYPPATKCAHDFATGAGLDAIETAYFGGVDEGAFGSDPRSRNDSSSGLPRAFEGGCIEVSMEKCVCRVERIGWYKN